MIHKFISKNDPALSRILRQAINILTESYFTDLSRQLLPLYLDNDHILHNQNYVNFVRNLQLNYDAIELYLLDTSGSCLFLTKSGNPIWLIIKHSDELANYEQIALDQDANNELLISLSQRTKIPFFFCEKDYETSPHDWNKYLYPARPLPGIPGYYYAMHEGHIRDNLNRKKIYSYIQYLNRE